MVRMFAEGLGDQGSKLDWAIPKTQNMVLGASLLNTQYYGMNQGWVEESRERSNALPYTLV